MGISADVDYIARVIPSFAPCPPNRSIVLTGNVWLWMIASGGCWASSSVPLTKVERRDKAGAVQADPARGAAFVDQVRFFVDEGPETRDSRSNRSIRHPSSSNLTVPLLDVLGTAR